MKGREISLAVDDVEAPVAGYADVLARAESLRRRRNRWIAAGPALVALGALVALVFIPTGKEGKAIGRVTHVDPAQPPIVTIEDGQLRFRSGPHYSDSRPYADLDGRAVALARHHDGATFYVGVQRGSTFAIEAVSIGSNRRTVLTLPPDVLLTAFDVTANAQQVVLGVEAGGTVPTEIATLEHWDAATRAITVDHVASGVDVEPIIQVQAADAAHGTPQVVWQATRSDFADTSIQIPPENGAPGFRQPVCTQTRSFGIPRKTAPNSATAGLVMTCDGQASVQEIYYGHTPGKGTTYGGNRIAQLPSLAGVGLVIGATSSGQDFLVRDLGTQGRSTFYAVHGSTVTKLDLPASTTDVTW